MSSNTPSTRPALPTAEEIASLPPDGWPSWNRLVFEQSPYLLQHAANPVDWWPWCPEAFEEARRLDRPVFLSIGYATCHWCHVMEHESFEDPEVAALMNRTFVNIKVDREERPDIDNVYMTVTQALTGRGGWPMTVVMTADKKPFFAGTYFPKSRGRFGLGMMELIPALAEAWRGDRLSLLKSAGEITEALSRMTAGAPGDGLPDDLGREALRQFSLAFDARFGGFGGAPKFPVPHDHRLLLVLHRETGDPEALDMVTTTLKWMRLGGMHDHVGFGFHRYSTDDVWLVPHFEKMLYDQALMVYTAVEHWQVTRTPSSEAIARETIEYVRRDMTDPLGGFYSAEDADSEGVEGKFYLWTPTEVLSVLGPDDGQLFCELHRIVPGGNFVDEATHESPGSCIPHLRQTLAEHAAQRGIDEADLASRIADARARLFAHRRLRIHPLKDDKVLTDWNGLMIAAVAKAAGAFDDQALLEIATRAGDFALAALRTPDGRLLKRWRNGSAGLPAHLEDHAFLAWGLLELYEAGFEPRFLEAAVGLTEVMIRHFADDSAGGFFMTADDGEPLLVRSKDIYDGAIPSGNSVAAHTLVRLGRITGRREWVERAHRTLLAFAGQLARSPRGHSHALLVNELLRRPGREIVLSGDRDHPELRAMASLVRRRYDPFAILAHRAPDPSPLLDPSVRALESGGGGATAFVCERFACKLPARTLPELEERLGS